jgi:predicted type IV restriction endonuclease
MSEIQDSASKAPNVKALPKWEQTARDRVKTNLPKAIKPIQGLMERDAVEADTRMLVTDFLCDVLGYDKYEDLTAEYQVKGDFADFGIRVDKQLKAFVEIKRVKQDLNKTHLRQVESYALREGVVWAILTNVRVWELYRVEPVVGEQSELTLLFSVDLLDEALALKKKMELLYLISREAIQKKVIDEHWKNQLATSPKVIKKALVSNEVIEAVKKEIYRTQKQRVDSKDVKTAIEIICLQSGKNN